SRSARGRLPTRRSRPRDDERNSPLGSVPRIRFDAPKRFPTKSERFHARVRFLAFALRGVRSTRARPSEQLPSAASGPARAFAVRFGIVLADFRKRDGIE